MSSCMVNNKRVDWAKSVFITLKRKKLSIEDNDVDFHFVNKLFKRENDLDIYKLE